jgi:hypothetical protein
MVMRALPVFLLAGLIAVSAPQIPQGVFTEALPPEEFSAHRVRPVAHGGGRGGEGHRTRCGVAS